MPAAVFRHAQKRRRRLAFESLCCIGQLVGKGHRDLRSGNRVTMRIENGVDVVIEHEEAAGDADKHPQHAERRSEPEMDLHPAGTQARFISLH
jgi:hypothetical protein